MMADYRVGIVGCGGMGRWYARGFQELGCKVVACADPKLENAEALASSVGGVAYTDFGKMYAEQELDLVAVCTWPTTHHRATVDAARSGVRGIICEKPLAVNLQEADEMIAVCDELGVKLVTGHQHRFAPWIRRAAELIRAGAVGKPQLIWGHCSLDLMNNGTHVIDTINALNQDVSAKWVFAQVDCSSKSFGRANHPDLHAEDAASVRVHYENGVEALVEVGDHTRQDFGFHVLGSDGVIHLENESVRYLTGDGSGWRTPALPPGLGGREKIEDLIRSVEEGSVPESSGRKGRVALEIIAGAFESVRGRRVVEFPIRRDAPTLRELVDQGLWSS